MSKRDQAKLKRREALLRKVTKLREALAGNLTSAEARSKRKGKIASSAYGPIWRLTWKERGKTRTFYVRIAELSRVRQGVQQMQEMKKTIRLIAEINMKLLLAARKQR
jgi:hypothetical protein